MPCPYRRACQCRGDISKLRHPRLAVESWKVDIEPLVEGRLQRGGKLFVLLEILLFLDEDEPLFPALDALRAQVCTWSRTSLNLALACVAPNWSWLVLNDQYRHFGSVALHREVDALLHVAVELADGPDRAAVTAEDDPDPVVGVPVQPLEAVVAVRVGEVSFDAVVGGILELDDRAVKWFMAVGDRAGKGALRGLRLLGRSWQDTKNCSGSEGQELAGGGHGRLALRRLASNAALAGTSV